MIKSLIELKRLEDDVFENCFNDVHGLSCFGSDALQDIYSVRRALLQMNLPQQRKILEGWKETHPNYTYEYEIRDIVKYLL